MEEFQLYFKVLLHQNNMTQRNYAEAAGVDPSQVSHLIAGRRKPNFEELSQMATIFQKVDYNKCFKKLGNENSVMEGNGEYNTAQKNLNLIDYHSSEIKSITKKLAKDINLTTKQTKPSRN